MRSLTTIAGVLFLFTRLATAAEDIKVLYLRSKFLTQGVELVLANSKTQRVVLDFNGGITYGSDDKSTAMIVKPYDKLYEGGNARLYVFDQQRGELVVTNKIVEWDWFLTKGWAMQTLAVSSQGTTIYFPSHETNHTSTIRALNWKTGETHPLSSPRPYSMTQAIDLDGDIGCVAPGTITVVDPVTKKEKFQWHFVPRSGFYYASSYGIFAWHGRETNSLEHELIATPSLRSVETNLKSFVTPRFDVNGSFITKIKGRTYMVWGENDSRPSFGLQTGTMTALVGLDLDSTKSTYHCDLGTKVMSRFFDLGEGNFLMCKVNGELFNYNIATKKSSKRMQLTPGVDNKFVIVHAE